MSTYVKTLSYVTRPIAGDGYEYVVRLLRHEIDPPSTAQACLTFPDGSLVYHSTHARVVDTLSISDGSTYLPDARLREVPFDLARFVTRDEWLVRGSVSVREAFLRAFTEDALLVTRNVVLNEVSVVFERLSSIEAYAVTHSFRLALLSAYCVSGRELMRNPAVFALHFDTSKKRFGFGQWLTIS